MKKVSLVAAISLVIMLLPLLAPFASAAQPPVVTDTLYVGTIGWGPRRADPVRAYDTGSGELIFNAYDTLIAFDREKYWEFVPSLAINVPERVEFNQNFTNTTSINPADPTGTLLETVPPDGREYEICGWVDNNPDGVWQYCDVVYIMEYESGLPITCRAWHTISVDYNTGTIQLHRFYYDFRIRTDPVVYFVDENGSIVDTFDIYDAEYSIKRGLVQDQYGSPMWMFYKPFFDQMNSDWWDTGNPEDAMCLAYLIKDAIEIISLDPPILRLNLGLAFPDVAFKQIMSQTWASMVSKDFSLSIGCWNGDLFEDTDSNGYPDWFETWRHISRSPYDTSGAYRYVGTGPYYVSVWDSVNKIVKLSRNPYYWQGWPAPGCGGYLETVEIRYIDDDDARITAFKAGDFDVAAIPRAKMSVLVEPDVPPGDPLYDPYTNYVDVPIKTIKNIPTLTLDALHFTFTINDLGGTNPYIHSGHFPDGIPTNFFNNTHVRKAWAYAFNWSNYIRDAYYGEGIYRKNPLVAGLAPEYYNSTVPSYYESLAMAEAELKAAVFPGSGYNNVWESGFEVTIAYNTGNTQREIACEMIAQFFTTLSTYDGRTGPAFKVHVINLDWPTILDKFENFELPTWIIGWLADFADADNWMRPYMHSYGDFSYFQGYTAENGWTTPGPNTGMNKDILIDLAVKTPDGEDRRIYYLDLQWIYYLDCPSIPLVQPTGRRWCQYWVKGWYYDALYPSQYYYHLWKADTCWFDISGPTPGVPDGVCNARDITYLILHFMASPPTPEKPAPNWVGTYGYGGVDPYGDRICNARDITWAILHFNHRNQP